MYALMPVILLFGAVSASAHPPKAGPPLVPKRLWGEWRVDDRLTCGNTDVGNRTTFGPRRWDFQGDALKIDKIRFHGPNSFSVYSYAPKIGSPAASFVHDPKTDLLIRDSEVFMYRCPATVTKSL